MIKTRFVHLRDSVEEWEEDGVELDVVLGDGVAEGLEVVAVRSEVVHERSEAHASAENREERA